MECSFRQTVALQYLYGVLQQVLGAQLGATLLRASVAGTRDLLQPAGCGSSPALLAVYSCHCPIAACSCLLSSSPSGSCSHADRRPPGCQGWLQALRAVMFIRRRNGENCLSVPNSLSLVPDTRPLDSCCFCCCLRLNCHQWLHWEARGTCKKLGSREHRKIAGVED